MPTETRDGSRLPKAPVAWVRALGTVLLFGGVAGAATTASAAVADEGRWWYWLVVVFYALSLGAGAGLLMGRHWALVTAALVQAPQLVAFSTGSFRFTLYSGAAAYFGTGDGSLAALFDLGSGADIGTASSPWVQFNVVAATIFLVLARELVKPGRMTDSGQRTEERARTKA